MVSASLLSPGERIVFSAHAHWKNLVVPVLVALLVGGGTAVMLLQVVPSPEDHAWQRWAVAVVGGLALLIFSVWPFLEWLTSTDTLTDRRLISRRGVLTREGKDIPIDRVHSVSYRRSVLDRMLGCGTLVVQTAGADSDVELYDVARLERRILQIQELVGADVVEDETDR